jgi:hypothetical protein
LINIKGNKEPLIHKRDVHKWNLRIFTHENNEEQALQTRNLLQDVETEWKRITIVWKEHLSKIRVPWAWPFSLLSLLYRLPKVHDNDDVRERIRTLVNNGDIWFYQLK